MCLFHETFTWGALTLSQTAGCYCHHGRLYVYILKSSTCHILDFQKPVCVTGGFHCLHYIMGTCVYMLCLLQILMQYFIFLCLLPSQNFLFPKHEWNIRETWKSPLNLLFELCKYYVMRYQWDSVAMCWIRPVDLVQRKEGDTRLQCDWDDYASVTYLTDQKTKN